MGMDLETRTMARVTRRLVPFLIICYFAAYLDRVNVSFAKLSMDTDLGILLSFNGIAGLRDWQWLFILEAVPAVVLSVVVFFYLTDRPADATWLAPDERTWLADRLEHERRHREAVRHFTVRDAILN